MTRRPPTIDLSPDLSLPIDAVTETFAILAIRGVGKTYTAKKMAEEILTAGHQVVIVDPVGVWWGLQSSADGSDAGLPIVVFGGDHGDVPLEPNAGELVADLVTDENLSVVLDLSLLRKGQQVSFMVAFAERLYHARGPVSKRTPVHLFIDEADSFCPQRGGRDLARVTGAIEDLVKKGRARGIGATLITQRSAVLNKNVLSQVAVLVAMRTASPQDRAAIDAWVEVAGDQEKRRELMTALPTLDVGEAIVWAPAPPLCLFARVKIGRAWTFDSSATPKVGETRIEPKKRADIDLGAITVAMGEALERQKANDPKLLRRQVAALEADLAAAVAKADQVPDPVVEYVDVPVLTDEDRELLTGVAEFFADERARVHDRIADLGSILGKVGDALQAGVAAGRARGQANGRSVVARDDHLGTVTRTPRPATTVQTVVSNDGDVLTLAAGARKILETLVAAHPMYLSKTQLAAMAGYSTKSSTWSQHYGTLKREGLLDERSANMVAPTDLGFDVAGVVPGSDPVTHEALVARWRAVLPDGPRSLFDVLLDGNGRTRDDLFIAAGYSTTSSTPSSHLTVLRRNDLVDVEGDVVSLSPSLFPSG